jgi:hypothetical protein
MVDNPGLWNCVLLDIEGKSCNSTAPAIIDLYNTDDHSRGLVLAGWDSHGETEGHILVYHFAGRTGFHNLLDRPPTPAYFYPFFGDAWRNGGNVGGKPPGPPGLYLLSAPGLARSY